MEEMIFFLEIKNHIIRPDIKDTKRNIFAQGIDGMSKDLIRAEFPFMLKKRKEKMAMMDKKSQGYDQSFNSPFFFRIRFLIFGESKIIRGGYICIP